MHRLLKVRKAGAGGGGVRRAVPGVGAGIICLVAAFGGVRVVHRIAIHGDHDVAPIRTERG